MGANHARTVRESSRAELQFVVDRDLVRGRAVAHQFECAAAAGLEPALTCDAVIIASSTASHLEVALPVLEAGIPVLIEKPLAAEPEEVYQILEAAQRADVPVVCGFVERFNPALATAISLLDEPVTHTHAVRHSPYNPRATSGVVSDLLIHDIDLALRLSSDSALPKVTSSHWTPEGTTTAEIVDCVLQFGSGAIANLSSSRWSQHKIRDVRIATDQSLYEIDLLRVTVSVFQHVRYWAEFGDSRSYRAQTIVDVPFVRGGGEPLSLQLAYFLDLVDGRGDIEAERKSIFAPHDVAARVEHQ
jgi:predicted dehydrogenase